MPYFRISLLLTILVVIIYSNSFNASWQLDDAPNIIHNRPIAITNLMPESLLGSLFAQPYAPGKLYRPVPMLTFAVNYYVGKESTFGYHLLNTLIHILCTLTLVSTVRLLLETPKLKKRFDSNGIIFISVLTGVLWAVHPIQTQAVTYIVQRMAALATLFYLTGIYAYLRLRLTTETAERRKFSLILILSFILALGSKENAALLPISLTLIEFIFFPSAQDRFSRYLRYVHWCIILVFATGTIYYFFSSNYHQNFFNPLGSRPFSVYERLITQPNILLFYVSLLIFPLASRLSIDHDVLIAQSMLDPWYTMPAIIIVVILLGGALLFSRRYPIFSFAVLFFFINHFIESSFIPLEIIFEHRNYLPSIFLFLPVAVFICGFIRQEQDNGLLSKSIILTVILIIIFLGTNTYNRNKVWANEFSLWQDAYIKAPNSARPASKLAELWGWHTERNSEHLEKAITYYQHSLDGYTPRTSFKPAIYGNMGELFFIHEKYDKAIEYYGKSLELNPSFFNSRIGAAKTYLLQGNFENGIKNLKKVPPQKRLNSEYFNIFGMVLIWQGEYRKAQMAFRSALAFSSTKKEYFYNNGVALSKLGYHSQADWFLKYAHKRNPGDINILLSIVENSLRKSDMVEAKLFTNLLIETFPLSKIHTTLANVSQQHDRVPINIGIVNPYVAGIVEEHLLSR